VKCPECGSEMFLVNETVIGDSFYYRLSYHVCPGCGYMIGGEAGV